MLGEKAASAIIFGLPLGKCADIVYNYKKATLGGAICLHLI